MVRKTFLTIVLLLVTGSGTWGQQLYWKQTGGPGGTILKLAFDSLETMYAMADYHLWRSSDGGATWGDVTPPTINGPMHGLAVTPGGTVFVGERWDYERPHSTYNIYRSTDQGKHWEIISIGGVTKIVTEDLRAATDGTVYFSGYAVNNKGAKLFLVSTDDGSTWTLRTSTILPTGKEARIELSRAGSVFLAFPDDPYYYRSTDKGVSWTKLINTPLAYWPIISGLDGTLYTYFHNNITGMVHKSTDNGRTWEALSLESNASFAITSANHLYMVGGGSAYHSADQNTWHTLYAHPDTSLIKGLAYHWGAYGIEANFHLTKVYANLRTTIHELSPDGMIERPVPCANVRVICPDVNGKHLSWTTHGLALSSDKGQSWQPSPFYVQRNVITGHDLYRIVKDSSGGLLAKGGMEIFRSTDGGHNWGLLKKGLGVERLVVAPNGSIFVLSEVNGIFRSTDLGASWDMIAPESFPQNKPVAIDCSREGTMYIAAGSSVYRSDDNGDTWITASVPSGATSIAASVDGAVFVSTHLHGIIRLTDNGVIMTFLNDGLPQPSSINELVTGPRGEVYGYSRRDGVNGNNVFYLAPQSSHWVKLDSGLGGISDISDLRVAADGTALLSTWGRGIFTLQNHSSGVSTPSNVPGVSLSVIPNPASIGTTINYTTTDSGISTLELCDGLGRRIATFFRAYTGIGTYTHSADLHGLAAGMYFVRLLTPAGAVVKNLFISN